MTDFFRCMQRAVRGLDVEALVHEQQTGFWPHVDHACMHITGNCNSTDSINSEHEVAVTI